MKNNQDAYGREIYDHFLGKKGIVEIVERDDGLISISSGPTSYFMEYKDWPQHQKRAIRFARGKVLDIGCGAGRVLQHLHNKGLKTTGIDNSPLAIKVCRERGFDNAVVRSVTQIAPDLGIFDTIVMYGNNFGLFGSFKRARWLLKKMHAMTSVGARIIAESLDPYPTTLPEHLSYQKRNRKKGRMSGQLKLRVRYLTYKSVWFDYLIVSEKEMRNILEGTGWSITKLFESGFGPYTVVIEKD